ncbi:MAG: hypothetical protein JSW50_15185 [Candidatus Latescibacterota bacterium]|nr:MAG: hypothetical protein JSW50_15185 [Candidatus Latescibacterota bacterium]
MLIKGVVVFLVVILAIAVCAGSVSAQGSNWWTNQYGTRAELLGGVVVGSFIDLSSTYYNPGAIALVRNQEVLLSAEAFQYQSLEFTNPEVPERTESTTRFGTAPTLFAGLFPSNWLTGQLAYSALTRQDFDFRLQGNYSGYEDVFEDLPGEEFYAAETYFDHELNENWYGATWSHSPKEGLGIGATLYGAYRSHRVRVQAITQGVSGTTGDGATLVYVDEYSYKTFRFLAKLGIALDYSPIEVGFTVTTPSLMFLGSGKAYYNRNIVGVDLDGDGEPDTELQTSQQDVSAQYKSPLSIAAGASYRLTGSAIHFSCEWFNGVGRYQTLDLQPQTTNLDPGTSLYRRVTLEYDPVFNLGLGLERMWTESFHGYVSFITDFTAATNEYPSGMDLYHILAGAAVHIKGLSLTLGVGYAFGGDTFQTLVDPSWATDGGAPFRNSAAVDVDYRRLRAIVGFAFTL